MSVPGMQERTILLTAFRNLRHDRMAWARLMRPTRISNHRLMTNSNSCTASFTQMAGIEALAAIRVPSITCAANSSAAAMSSSRTE